VADEVRMVQEVPPNPPPRVLTLREKWLRRGLVIAVALMLVMSGGTLVSQQIQQASFTNSFNSQRSAQAAQSAVLSKKLCTTLHALASLKAPESGAGPTQAGRVYEQRLQSTLAELYGDVGCKS